MSITTNMTTNLQISTVHNILLYDGIYDSDDTVSSDNTQEIEDVLEEDKDFIIQNLLKVLDKYVKENIKTMMDKKYKYIWREYLTTYTERYLKQLILTVSSITDIYDGSFDGLSEYVDTLVNEVLYYHEFMVPPRSSGSTHVAFYQTEEYKKDISRRIDIIREKDKLCAEQRTPLWYEQRYNKLSASSAWKVLGTQSSKNSIILQKCRPLDVTSKMSGSINTPFHWGHKFEPISQMYYEYLYGVKVEEFGCIPHNTIEYLGASPDGIVTGPYDNERYGRMLEIKNVVSRVIDGIPKKEYWVQMQMQMECCDLEECDFLECQFKLYETQDDFEKDGTFQRTANGSYKGVIIMFNKDETPFYEYSPFNCDYETFVKWEEKVMEKNKDVAWIENQYWYLPTVSCVLVKRNPDWFECVKTEFEDVWNTILHERVNGYSHREPKRRTRKLSEVDDNDKLTINVIKKDDGMTGVDALFDICNVEEQSKILDNIYGATEDNTKIDTDTTEIKHKSKSSRKSKTNTKTLVIHIDDL